MKCRGMVITVVVFMTTLLFVAPALAVEFTPSELEELSAGKLIRKPLPNSRQNGFYGGAGFTIVDAPVEVVWKAIVDWDVYPQIFPRTMEAKEVSRKGDKSLVRILIGYKILTVKYHIIVSRDWDTKTITFNLAENRAHDLTETRGYWRLLPQPDGRTLVAYVVAVQVPPGIVTFLGDSMERKLEKSVIGLPKYVKKFIENKAGNRYGRMTARAK